MDTMIKTCCFTGHRQEKIEHMEDDVRIRLEKEIDDAIADGVKVFISGMASGFDTWAAEAVLERKSQGISLICAVPYEGFCKNNEILKEAAVVHNISGWYYHQVFAVRNKWMVDKADIVIACYDGTEGGTRQTINYAKSKGKKVINILMPDTYELE